MKQRIFVLAGFLSILLLWTGCPNNAPVPAGSGSGSSGGGAPEATLKAYPADQAILYTTADGAKASGGIGKKYSVQLGKQPRTDGYATVGDRSKGSYRIPSIVKTTVGGKTRLVAAFDVRYRGTFKGNGDVGTTDGGAGSDITVMYSDNGGATWTAAKNKVTGQKPAIDVDNTYGSNGLPTAGYAANGKFLKGDVCDPQLTVFPDGTIYCGMAGGAGVLGGDWSKSNFRIFKSVDNGATWEEDTDPNDSYAKRWEPSTSSNINKFNMTAPGHGIVLQKDVPGVNSMKAQTVVLPCQAGSTASGFGLYLAHGTGKPRDWQVNAANGSTPFFKWNNKNNEEGQICQLDDGSILMVAKTYLDPSPRGITLSRFKDDAWTAVPETNNPFFHAGACQVSVLKVAEGNGTKCGVVAVCCSLDQPSNTPQQGRGNLTVGFARDLTLKGAAADKPLDDAERYYVNIRKEGMCYFGYTDMIMVDDHTLGVLYENWHETDNSIDGMRFVAIDVSKIIEKLSVKP